MTDDATARAAFILAAAKIERDVRLSELTDAEMDSLISAMQGLSGTWKLAGFAPCPTCGQYDHSISSSAGQDKLAAAFMHFQSMFSHRGDGLPTQFTFDERTRDAAQVLMAAARPDAIAAAVAGEREAGVWHRIADVPVPKDTDVVVGWWFSHPDLGTSWETDTDDLNDCATHWRPLPAPPAAAVRGGG